MCKTEPERNCFAPKDGGRIEKGAGESKERCLCRKRSP